MRKERMDVAINFTCGDNFLWGNKMAENKSMAPWMKSRPARGGKKDTYPTSQKIMQPYRPFEHDVSLARYL